MLFYHIALLALVQGISEFLPISSSGHLILLHNIISEDAIKNAANNRLMDIAVHVGTLFAVLVYFHKDVWRMAKGLWALPNYTRTQNSDTKLMLHVLVGSLPIIIVGGIVYKMVDPSIFYDPRIIAYTTIIFGILMWVADKYGGKERRVEDVTFKDSFFIGLMQCLALIPGTSRSGITMTAARFRGLIRAEAARYSMLLSIIATSAVGAMGILDIVQDGNDGLLTDAMIAAGLTFLTALLVIAFLMEWLKRFSLTPFVIYRLILGAVLFYFFVL